MSVLNEAIVRSLAAKASVPIVFRGYVKNWPLCQWSLEKWIEVFGEKELPFRSMKKDFQSDEPCWERRCREERKTFKEFADAAPSSDEWMYFDYIYLHEYIKPESELYKEVSWGRFGYLDKGPSDTTLWVGSAGAHTPAHQDTYGVNIVTQVHGKKRWILFPPESGGMKPTRVPYEESSVYSELNFYCPVNVHEFRGLTGGRVVELSAGDALVVPHGWWHYVQNEDPINISLNMWLPHEKDKSTRFSEAAIKIFVGQICKDLPEPTIKQVLNPNEDDLPDTPLTVLFLQLEAAAEKCMDNDRKSRRAKRQKTNDEDLSDPVPVEYDLKALIDNPTNGMSIVPIVTGEELVKLIEETKSRYVNNARSPREDEVDGNGTSLCLTKTIINSFCDGNVVDLFKHNLFTRMS